MTSASALRLYDRLYRDNLFFNGENVHETSRGRFEFNTMFILCTCTGMMTQLCSLRLTNFRTLIL